MLDPEGHKKLTAYNRAQSAKVLTDKGISFTTANNGAHLVVSHYGKVADFWPGTGKYQIRGSDVYRRGVFNLIRELEQV